ncbi:MAG: decaprenyl-phosphate phosphoribosyltransferase [Chloroflexi bacterium]|nr:decaprenyl-phosphate phosphoribosyltransferase [Chloroflexota bacterium]MYE41711.1 decaprenyl-phosphate phosphoribosyltransferase [Chloroflexota bacterium]
MVDALRLMRPLQWAKNGLVFLPFLFAVDIAWSVDSAGNVPDLLFRLVLVFLGFCGMASGVYVLNDLMDRKADRRHPTKRNRPIASGRVSVPVAVALMVALIGAGLAVIWYVAQQLGLVGLIYIAINVGYSLGGKNLPLLDVFAVASGYVIRAVVGALAIEVEPSPWLYTTTGAGALFIVLGRRYAEVRLAGEDAGEQRSALNHYAGPFISQLLNISATAALLSYTLYTIEADNLPDNNAMLFTLPLVALGLFRYLYLLNTSERAEAPEQLMVRDLPLLACIVAWLAVSAVVLLNG